MRQTPATLHPRSADLLVLNYHVAQQRQLEGWGGGGEGAELYVNYCMLQDLYHLQLINVARVGMRTRTASVSDRRVAHENFSACKGQRWGRRLRGPVDDLQVTSAMAGVCCRCGPRARERPYGHVH